VFDIGDIHARASELLNWRLYPGVRRKINLRLADSRQVWSIDMDKIMTNLFRIGSVEVLL
jgi:hypothetical protein